MGQNRNVSGEKNIKKEVFQPGGQNVVWRLDEDIGGISDWEKSPVFHAGDKVRNNVVISARHQFQRNRGFVQLPLKLGDRLLNLWT